VTQDRKPLVIDFAPHAIQYVGGSRERWFASMIQYPWLLTLDAEGNVVSRVECPNIERVVDGQFAVGFTGARVMPANIQRQHDSRSHSLKVHAVASGKELWRRESGQWVAALGSAGIVARNAGLEVVDLATGADLWSTDFACEYFAHDARHVYVTRNSDSVIVALDRRTGALSWTSNNHRPEARLPCVWADALWFVCSASKKGARIVALSAETGKPVAEHEWPSAVTELVAAHDALLVVDPSGIACLRDGSIARIAENLCILKLHPCGRGYAARTVDGFAWTSDIGRPPVLVALADNERGGSSRRYDWDSWYPGGADDDFVIAAMTRVLRIPLALTTYDVLRADVAMPSVGDLPREKATVFFVGESRLLVEHRSRGRFWFDVGGTGLVKGDPVEIGGVTLVDQTSTIATMLMRDGKVLCERKAEASTGPLLVAERIEAKPRKRDEAQPTKAFLAIVDVLVEHGLIPLLSADELADFYADYFPDDYEVDATTAAAILSSLNENGSGVARGVVVHDYRFLGETDDVVAEFVATMGEEPITFARVGTREGALQIRSGDKVQWVGFDRRGLDEIAAWLNRRLEAAGARRRIFALETGSEEHCYVVRAPEQIEAMKLRGVRGFGLA